MKSLNQAMEVTEVAYSYGFTSMRRALTVMYNDIAGDQLTDGLCRVGSYWAQDKKTGRPVKRYAIFEVIY